uniref:Cellular tumor antigen p53 n=2 Tax=Bactrocera dorsalis TaxID=27457 RepID=A0A034VRW3_BACDO
MIQSHCDNSGSSNTTASPIKITTLSDTTINMRTKEQREIVEDNKYITLEFHSQELQQFLTQSRVRNGYGITTNQIDIFTSEANSGYEQLSELENMKPLPLTPENYPNSVITNEYSCSSNQTNKDTTMTDIVQVSDASNPPDELNKEEDIIPSDEPYQYLQELNSDNLMQFSQQSAIQELILKQQLDAKPNLDILPTFEEHDIGGYKFNVQIGSNTQAKKSWMYSPNRKKLYIRMNEILSLEAVYVPKLPLQQLRVRVLMSFKNEVSEPVVRCQNHLSKDTESHQKRRHSLLRCENPTAEYCGTADGKSINDRYSILIPLGLSAMPKNDSSISQTIAIKFTCQNSCIGRRETSILFLLEGMSGEILSQRVLDVKICSCPKRDFETDERNSTVPSKRKSSGEMPSRTTKLMKSATDSSKHPKALKDEDTSSDLENSDSGISIARDVDMQPTPSGGYRFVIEGDKEMMQKVIEYVSQVAALKILDAPQQAKHYNKMYRQLSRYRERLQRK